MIPLSWHSFELRDEARIFFFFFFSFLGCVASGRRKKTPVLRPVWDGKVFGGWTGNESGGFNTVVIRPLQMDFLEI